MATNVTERRLALKSASLVHTCTLLCGDHSFERGAHILSQTYSLNYAACCYLKICEVTFRHWVEHCLARPALS